MHGHFSSEFYSTPSIPGNAVRRRWHLNMLEPLEYGKDIPEEVVWDIVSRWHGMRLLFAIYLDKAINEAYVNSTFSYTSGVNRPDTTEASASEGDMPKPSQIPGSCANGTIPEDRKGGYERFYKALTAQWVAIEKLWRVRSQVWPNAQKFDDAFDSTLRQWTNNPARPIREKLDIVEIVDFIWGFAGRKAFHVSDVPSWLEGEDDLVRDQYIDQNESEVGDWGFFVRSVIQFLRPPQIIQLVLSSWYPSSWNYDRPGFLRHLGLFDTWDGVLVDDQDSPMSDNWVPLDIVDDDVGNSFAHMDNSKEVERRWEKYREVLWPKEIKGKLFLQTTAEREILCKISESS
ncbi:uncharacterized protein N7446_012020 [Penicillium canescens]|nr:uncharacterized protein N7446_012020 [Penicillium canescens]KAJ6047186.1 hypothetical protein N7446_012020 [Penicillium canescens]KAJ6174384.1 hypothetical protein N7485_005450 [Penicillium canescens]